MKRGGPAHPKIIQLSETLSIPIYAAVGLMEMLYHWTWAYAKDGGIGKYSDQVIARGMGWDKDADVVLTACTRCGLVDANDVCRLYVHGWHEHAEDSIHMSLARSGKRFANGTIPNLNKFGKDERSVLSKAYVNANGVGTTCEQETHCLALPCLALPSHALPHSDAVVNPKSSGGILVNPGESKIIPVNPSVDSTQESVQESMGKLRNNSGVAPVLPGSPSEAPPKPLRSYDDGRSTIAPIRGISPDVEDFDGWAKCWIASECPQFARQFTILSRMARARGKDVATAAVLLALADKEVTNPFPYVEAIWTNEKAKAASKPKRQTAKSCVNGEM